MFKNQDMSIRDVAIAIHMLDLAELQDWATFRLACFSQLL